jgi:hypothetical protein
MQPEIMQAEIMQAEIWIGLVHIRPNPGCHLLSSGAKGAYTQVFAWARDFEEYRSKVDTMFQDYKLFVMDVSDAEPVRLRTAEGYFDDEATQEDYERAQSGEQWVIFSTLNQYMREEA